MKKPPPASIPDWRSTNPGYEVSETRTYRLNGREVVEIDGGKIADMAMLHERMTTKP